MKYNYPISKRDESVVDSFKSSEKGTSVNVKDPYRWLEDPNSNETKKWIEEQNALTKSVLGTDNLTDKIQQEYLKRLNYERYSFIRRRGDWLFYDRNPGLLNQSIYYMANINDLENEIEILDPNKFSKDGTWSLSTLVISESGRYIVYGYSQSGSDWVTFKMMHIPADPRVEKIVTMDDTLEWSKFSSPVFDEKETGIIYGKFPIPESAASNSDKLDKGTETDSNTHNMLYYHRFGEPQSKDTLIMETPKDDPHWMFSCEFTNDYKYLLVYISKDCNPEHNLYVITNWNQVINDHSEKEFKVIKLVEDFNAFYHYITNVGQLFYFNTNLNAPQNRVITLELPTIGSDKKDWNLNIKDLIPEKPYLCQSASVSKNNKLYVNYLKDIKDFVEVYDMDGKLIHEIQLPAPGSCTSFYASHIHNHIYFGFESFTYPYSIFHINTETDKLELVKSPKIEGYDPTNYESIQIFYESPKDKTKIPMFITYKKGLKLDGSAPTWLTAYGGFDYAYTPYYAPSFIYFIDKFDGVFAVANIRGGGEYGKKWYESGKLKNKQNCFDDFAGAAQYLYAQKYTCKDRLVVNGGSNGGLLMCVIANQYPDVFKCVISDVPVTDMLRFHKFTIGKHWTSDYGCSDNPEDFDSQIKYSPVHNVPVGGKEYPSILCLTGAHDDRVVPLHTFKFIAEAQHQQGSTSPNPILTLIDIDSGHGAGKPLSKRAKEISEKFNFVSKSMGVLPKLNQ
eukprot:gene11350-13897_t